jgi:uncharacterized protein YbaR (Trm112 family)
MIDKRLLQTLVCPKTRTPLSLADETLLAAVNQWIAAGRVENGSGKTVREPLVGGLVDQQQTLLYPIVDDIPVLLIDEAIPLDQIA